MKGGEKKDVGRHCYGFRRMPVHKNLKDTVRIAKQVYFISRVSNKYIPTPECCRSC